MQSARAREQQPAAWTTAADLPAELADEAIEVYVNGVRQLEGRDFRRDRTRLLFQRPLAREGRLGFWRWAGMALGIAGTYRQNDTVAVIHERGGRRAVLSGLPLRRLG